MKILVCGSRTYELDHVLPALLDSYRNAVDDLTIINGGARGADQHASEYGWLNGTRVVIYEADWNNQGKKAGPLRNQHMLEAEKPDLVLAFIDKPLRLSHGTSDMVNRAKRSGIPIYIVERVQ